MTDAAIVGGDRQAEGAPFLRSFELGRASPSAVAYNTVMIRYVQRVMSSVLGREQRPLPGSPTRLNQRLSEAQEGLGYILTNLRMLEAENSRYHAEMECYRRSIDEAMTSDRHGEAELQAASLLQVQTALDRNETQLEAARLSFERIASLCRSLEHDMGHGKPTR